MDTRTENRDCISDESLKVEKPFLSKFEVKIPICESDKIKIKEEPVSEINLKNRMDFLRKSETNIPINKDISEIVIKQEIKEELNPERTEKVKSETRGALFSSACLENGNCSFPSVHIMKCKNNRDAGSDNEINSKLEIKEEPWWFEKTSLDVPVSDLPLQNQYKDICNVIDKDLSAAESLRCYKQQVFTVSSSTTLLPSSETLEKQGCVKIEEENLECETANVCECRASDVTETTQLEQCLVSSTSIQSLRCSSAMCLKNECLKCGHKKHESHEIQDKTLPQISNFKQSNLIHEGKRLHKCEICDKSFTQPSHLKTHNFIHEGIKPYQCEICEKSFSQMSNLKKHKLIHEGSKPYSCGICEKTFTQTASLKRHKLSHDGQKPYNCEICERSFSRMSNLKTHNLIHEGKRPYSCETCDKSFSRKSHLKMHNLGHEGKKPHSCQICQKRFTRMSNLKMHFEIHTLIKPHNCEMCNKSFYRLSHLKSHSLTHAVTQSEKI